MPYKKKRRPSVSRKLKIIMVVCALLVAAMVITALTLNRQEYLAMRAEEARNYTPPVTLEATLAETTEPAEETPAPTAATIEPAAALVAGTGPLTISVLGDSTGNSTGEWVDLWARDLAAAGNSVTIHLWDQETEQWRDQTVSYPGGPRQITIWNGSMPGAQADYPRDKLDVIQPEQPDLLILNYGHNGQPSAISGTFQATLTAVDEKWDEPFVTVAVIQNAAAEPRAVRSADNHAQVREWALSAGVPVIDVRAAFEEQPDLAPLIVDDGTGVHPNEVGSRIWADTVTAALG